MSWLVRAVLVTSAALLCAPADAATKKATTSAVAKKKKKATKAKKAKKKRPSKASRKVATAKRSSSKVELSRTPSITVSSHHGDGRVRYGKDNMPPGFAWPPTTQMLAANKACEATLTAAELPFEPAPPLGRLVDPIYVPSMEFGGIAYTPAYSKDKPELDCQLARVLVTLGPQLHAIGVRGVQYISVYRNTNVRVHGQTKNILSRHALGLAMDIKAFVDENGRVVDVELEYLKGDPLLHAIEDLIDKSTDFRIVLTPGNDPLSHYNHFHIEASVDFTGFR